VVSQLRGDEPTLEVGDSGEGVVELQVRLYQLGYYRQFPDGTYNMTTENAVRELQSAGGQDNTGEVTQETWQAIVYWEQQRGIDYQYHSPYDALTQLRYDLEHPATASGEFPAGDPSLSEDGQWRWDGNDWQPVAGAAGPNAADPNAAGQMQAYAGQLSEDGQWQWDGSQWVAAQAGGSGTAAGGSGDVGELSPDGQWRWDGSQWQAVTADGYVGQLSPDGQWRWDGSQWQAA
jgi:peptidoglycan hydrolase-like protein with peptidoglycan-binding domain